jgi:acyl-coenzyme A thioesterase PaaI-like protein
MTDISEYPSSLPNQLGTSAWSDDAGDLVVDVRPGAATIRHGVVRASVLAFVVDAVAGIVLDTDPDSWTLTSELTLRVPAAPPPERIEGRATVLRDGRRSAVGEVHLVDAADPSRSAGYGVLSFSRVRRRDTDGPKFTMTPEHYHHFGSGPPLDEPLDAAAGIRVLDAARGVVEVDVEPSLLNPAGTLQGAMVALVAEVAAEAYLSAAAGGPVVLCDLDVRYLGQARDGTVRSSVRPVLPVPDSPVVVELRDAATDRLLTHVLARGVRPRDA